ncbi:hypothetical protein ACS3SW_17590 [Roseobacteraceae bacterium S113]
MTLKSIGLILGLAVAGCGFLPGQTSDEASSVSTPEAAGLVPVRPYPTDQDTCQIMGESEATSEFLDHTAILIGCPTSEVDAITDRRREGGQVLDEVGDWTLISLPQG